MLDGYSSPVELGNSAPTSPRLESRSRNSLKEISESFNKSSGNIVIEKNEKNLNVEKFIEDNNTNNINSNSNSNNKINSNNNKEDSSFLSNSNSNNDNNEEENTQISNISSNISNLNLEKSNEEDEEYSNLKENSTKENSNNSATEKNNNDFFKNEKNEKEKIFRKMTCEPFIKIEPKIKICREEDFQIETNFRNFSNLRKMELSNCWNSISKAKEKHEEIFAENKINKEEFFKNPWKIISSANLAIKFGNHVYTWKVIAPIIMSTLCFGEDLPEKILSDLTLEEQGYFFWRTVNQDAYKIDIEKNSSNINNSNNNNDLKQISRKNSAINNENDNNNINNIEINSYGIGNNNINDINDNNNINEELSTNFTNNRQSIKLKDPEDKKLTKEDLEKDIEGLSENLNKKQLLQYRKSNTPTSEQIKSLNLKEGKNEITFVVTNRYQGEVKFSTEIYLWNHNDKIIISDLDGTITKSDVLGQVLPMFGRDWSHKGVVKLYNDIFNNGYKILYLTARALCQSDQTKNYLNKLQQSK